MNDTPRPRHPAPRPAPARAATTSAAEKSARKAPGRQLNPAEKARLAIEASRDEDA